ncbi:MAG TPA: EamA family transporter [Rugosimonospora sp.]|nr:EamA family transporter [Rugosimonospora sp.]
MLFALASSLFYGVSDFFGGIAARRSGVLVVTAISHLAATAALALAALAVPGTWSVAAVWTGGAAGLAAVIGFVTFYGALASGPISLLSPGIAVLQSVVPVVFGVLVFDDRLRLPGWVGILAAIVAGLLLAGPASGPVEGIAARALLSAAVSGLALGLSVVALNAAPGDSGMVPVLVEVLVGLVLLVALLGAAWIWPAVRPWTHVLDAGEETQPVWANPRTVLLPALLAGALLGAGDGLLMAALRRDALAVVAVLIGLYPLATVILARVVLRERLRARQIAGVALAILSSAILGLA